MLSDHFRLGQTVEIIGTSHFGLTILVRLLVFAILNLFLHLNRLVSMCFLFFFCFRMEC